MRSVAVPLSPFVTICLALIVRMSTAFAAAAPGVAPIDTPDPVLFETKVDCGSCYWDLALAGHPDDPNHLALIGALDPPRLSHDGGATWAVGTLSALDYVGQPALRVTPDGVLLLASGVRRPHPGGGGDVVAGGFFRGGIDGSAFAGTTLHDAPAGLPPEDTYPVFTSPKLAYDPVRGAVYVVAFGVRFDDDTSGNGLFVSLDGGQTFRAQNLGARLVESPAVSPLTSVDVMPDGALRAVFSAYEEIGEARVATHLGAEAEAYRERNYLVRFSPDAQTFTIVPAIGRGMVRVGVARIEPDSNQGLLIDEDVKIAVDRTSGGARAGRIYIAWAEAKAIVEDPDFDFGRYGTDFDVYLAYSDDDGATWSAPLRLNDDGTNTDQFFPSLRVDAAGVVHVAFVDKRHTQGTARFDVYYVRVTDGQRSMNVRVSGAPTPHGASASLGSNLEMVMAYPDLVYVAYPCGGAEVGSTPPTAACVAALDPDLVRVCGDVDADGRVTVTDGVQVLRAAAGLSNPCDAAQCDVDGDRSVSVVDGVNVMRLAADLRVDLRCGPR